eukprot:9254397-Pyramimonas_sp.AAC.1
MGGERMRTPPWGLRWRSPWGHEALGWGPACERRHWGLRWSSSLWGHGMLCWAGEAHANTAAGVSGGAPSWVTER